MQRDQLADFLRRRREAIRPAEVGIADGTARLARAGLLRMLDLLGDTPALVYSDLGVVLAQNRASLLLAGDLTRFTGDRRYMMYRWFTDPANRTVHPVDEQDYHARQLVADFRVAAGRRPGDPEVAGLVDRLSAASADFARLWAEHEVAVAPAGGADADGLRNPGHPRPGPAAAGAHPGRRRGPRADEPAARARHRGVLGILIFPYAGEVSLLRA